MGNAFEQFKSIYNSIPKESISIPGRLRHPQVAEAPRDVLNRFDGLAADYDRHRPGYTSEMLDYLFQMCELRPGLQVVDVGCGTGISTRMLASRGLHVIGIEPNADMRRQAEAVGFPTGWVATYRDGRAEATGLPDECASLVLAAQAFHWFANDSSLREFHRLLKPSGWLALLWNEQDRSDPFTEVYFQALVRYSPEPHIAARSYTESADLFLRSALFDVQPRKLFANQQNLDEEQLIGRAFSASFAPKKGDARQQLESYLRYAFAKYQQNGLVVMRYETALFLGRKLVGV
jgi:ubiquinone/menaquinone biosynthesis C-methylase UbiE